MMSLPSRGELWWCELSEIGRRPVVVLSRDAAVPQAPANPGSDVRARLGRLSDVRMRELCDALEVAVDWHP
ncbi:MAG: hypothetical protein ACR2KC_00030 [Acidimicrobiales bacterium]